MKNIKLSAKILILILLSLGSIRAQVPADSNWSSMFSRFIDPGGPIQSIYVDDNSIYIGGFCKGVENIYTLNGIGTWVDGSWKPLVEDGKIGIHGLPFTMTKKDGNLYVGGWFDVAGNTKATNIAMWNGSNWSALGNGINGGVSKLVVHNNLLYVCGGFDSAGTISAKNIAKWNGSNWSSVSGTPNGAVKDILFADTSMYIIGEFDSVGRVPAMHIARWDGYTWSALGSGIKGYVDAICLHDSTIIVGGEFDTIGTAVIHNIASWNGSKWSALGSGTNGGILALTVDGNDVYAAGDFWLIGTDTIRGIAKWSTVSSTWSPLGSGIPGITNTLFQHNHRIFAGGSFLDAGEKGSRFIAVWDTSEYQNKLISSNPSARTFSIGNSFPNPTDGTTIIPIMIHQAGNVIVSIFDSQGNLVQEVLREFLTQGNYTAKWNTQSSASGNYYCRVIHNAQMQVQKISVVRE